jgi:uncharacterized protein (TIGR03437 family)
MKRFVSKGILIMTALAAFAAVAPLANAQASSVTQVSTTPNGLQFFVDDQLYTSKMGAVWPQGSKHTLSAIILQKDTLGTTLYTFSQWQWSGGALPGSQVVVTADPTISGYQAVYTPSYALSVQFNNCPTANCVFPGTVYVNGVPTNYDQTFFIGQNGSAVIQAVPASGYVFVGWGSTNAGSVLQGFQQTLTMTQPMTVYPEFQIARTINFASIPSGLQVLADGEPLTTPASLQLGYNTTHPLGVVTPQQDNRGQWWVWQSWSDGGNAEHTYKVAAVPPPDTVTATFVQGVNVTLATDPQGLNLTVDGVSNLPTYNFVWGVGQAHTISAPAQQTDAQGHIWSFTGWSNGSTASQTVTVPPTAVPNGMRMVATYAPVAHLTVTNSLAGVSLMVNGTACTSPCDVYPPVGAQVDVSTTPSVPLAPGTRQDFLSWNVNGATKTSTQANGDLLVTLGQNAVTASPNYHLMNLLNATANPQAGATFSFQPSSPDNFYDSQATVTVKASVQPGYQFRSWTGDLSGPAPTGAVAMSSPRAVMAMLNSVPFIMAGGVINGAAVTPQSVVAPGSIVSVFGANLAQDVAVGASNPMVQTLGGVTVSVGTQIVPLYFVSPTQINFQLPNELAAGPQMLTISSTGQPNASAPFTVAPDAPGLFPVIAYGVPYGIVTHADGSAVTTGSPAQAGETLTVLGTGFGATTPERPAGYPVPSSQVYALTDPITVTIGGVSVTPSNAYAQSGSVGVDVVQFVVPTGLPSAANASLAVAINGVTSNAVQVPIQ